MARIAILGTGAWGTALANVLLSNKHHVAMWGVDQTQINDLKKQVNTQYYGNTKLVSPLKLVTKKSEDIINFKPEYVVIAVPSIHISSTLEMFANKFENTPVYINVAKGFDLKTKNTWSLSISKIIKNNSLGLVTLIGPSFATEVFNKNITVVNTVSDKIELAKKVGALFNTKFFKCVEITDVKGAETISAIKNIMAIGSGILYAQHNSINTRAAILAQIAKEVQSIVKIMGGEPSTLYQFCGIGDIFLTCTDSKSRNFSFGLEIGKFGFKNVKKVLKNNTVEGYWAAKVVYQIITAHGIKAPILTHIYKILYNNESETNFVQNIINEINK